MSDVEDDEVDFYANFLEMAAHFRQVQDNAPELFAVIAKLADVSLRKAYYLVSIDRTFGDLGVPRARLRAIGWSKLKMVIDLITTSNCEELLSMAEASTVREFGLLLRGREPISGTRCVTLYFEPAEYELFAAAVLANGGTKAGKGLVGKEAALIQFIKSATQSNQQDDKGKH